MNQIRLDWIDFSKGIGIILVVYGHVTRGMNEAGITFGSFKNIDEFIYAFHMPLFFILSGYFFLKSVNKGYKKYTISKINTLIYPYLIWSLIQVSIQFLASSATNTGADTHDILTFFLPRGQFWFLLALFNISIFNMVLYSFLKNWWLVISSLGSLIFIINPIDLGILNNSLFHLIYFNIGVLLFDQDKLRASLLQNLLAIIINGLLFITLSTLLLLFNYHIHIYDLILALSGSLFIAQIGYRLAPYFGHINLLGKQSMIIYLMHIIIASGTRIVLLKIFGVESILIHIALGTSFGVYIPFLFWYLGLYKKFIFLFEPKLKLVSKKVNS